MDKFVKRIQTRLSRQGFSFNKQQIREAYQSLVKDPLAPTEAEMNSVINQLKFQLKTSFASSTQLTVPEPLVSEDLIEQIEKPEAFEITPSSHPDVWETLQLRTDEQPTEETNLKAFEHQELVIESEPLSEMSLVETESKMPNFSPPTNPLTIQQSTTGINQAEVQGFSQPLNHFSSQQSTAGISQAEITQAIALAVQQVGSQGNAEAVEMLTSLANELTDDIKDTQEMVTALVTAYLGKRQVLLSSAIGTLNTLRSAQTESFQAGLDQDFFGQKQKNKKAFLSSLSAMFN